MNDELRKQIKATIKRLALQVAESKAIVQVNEEQLKKCRRMLRALNANKPRK